MTRRFVVVALLTAAVLAPVARWAFVQTIEWTPLDVPLSGKVDVSWREEFAIEHSGKYELAVRIDRPQNKTGTHHAECLLGFDRVGCEGIAPMPLQWHLASADGASIRCADRVGGGRFTDDAVERWLECFDAVKGRRYALRVDAPTGAGALEQYAPRFIVTSSSALDRQQHSVTAAVWLASLLLGFMGLLLAVNRS